MEEMRLEVGRLIQKVKVDEQISWRTDLIRVLEELQVALGKKRPNWRRIDRLIFGVWRVTTDDSSIEEGPTGQELLALTEKIGRSKK